MNSIVGDRYIAELVQIFEQQGTALYAGQHSLCLTVPCLHYIQRKLSAVQEPTGNPLPTQFGHLQQLQESFGRIMILKLISDRNYQLSPAVTLSLDPFKSINSLIIKKVPLSVLTGLSRLRSQLQSLVIQRCGVQSVEEVIVKCAGDDSGSFSWASLRELDFSHNSISQLGDSLQFLTAIEKMDLSNNVITDESRGIELIDGVTYLHLGFNQLKIMPCFGPRAKFNLTALNLRNNHLTTIEGIQELDSLTDLDLTDNLLTRHSDLQPLRNLHNLCLLSLVGNPLSFHPKHRVKSVETLSNLINPSSFRLDGKKLSASEKKAIPRSLTHYPGSTPSLSPHESPLHTHTHALTPPPSSQLMNGDSPVYQSDTAVISTKRQRRHKKAPATRVVALHDTDEEHDSLIDTGSGGTGSSVPLRYEKRIQKIKDLSKQMPDIWLLSNASLDTTSSESNQQARGASQPRTAREHPPLGLASMESVGKAVGDSEVKGPRLGVASKKSKKSAVAASTGMPAADEPRTSTPIVMSEIDGAAVECFLVERYESDVEEGEEGEGENILLTLSDRFLEEKDINGKILDRMDLGCLMTVEVRRKPWKSAQQPEVVTLQFNHERRDRRKREYIMIELNHDAILGILGPICEQNQEAFSLASKVECFTCQRVFDATESLLMPLLTEAKPLTPPQRHSQGTSHPNTHRQQQASLANRYCPFCKSQQIQYLTNTPHFKRDNPKLSSSTSPRFSTSHSKDSSRVTVSEGEGERGSVKLGFAPSSDGECAPVSVQPPGKRQRSSAFVEEQSENVTEQFDTLEQVHSHTSTSTTVNPKSDITGNSDTTATTLSEDVASQRENQYSISSWSFSELSEHPTPQRYLHTSSDVLYHSKEQIGAENTTPLSEDMRYDFKDGKGYSSSYPRDTDESRTNRDKTDSRLKHKQRYSTMPGSNNRSSAATNDLVCSSGNSGRLTNSEPTPKLLEISVERALKKREAEGHTTRGLRGFPSHEPSHNRQRQPFDDRGSLPYTRSPADSGTPRMRLPRASLGSVQEQPSSKSLNPFDDSLSTNPFDLDDSTASNPFGTGDDEDCVDQMVGEHRKSGNRAPFSHSEEQYFPEFQSHHKARTDHSKDKRDSGMPRSTDRIPAPSSSVPVHSHMSYFGTHTPFGSVPRDYPVTPNKSSTLPYGRSPRSTKESPEISKRSAVTLPRGKPPVPGGLVRGKSMESLDRFSPRNEQHPSKSNRIVSPSSRRRQHDPFSEIDPGGGVRGSRTSDHWSKNQRNTSSPSVHNRSSSSGKSTPEAARRGHSSSDTQSTGRGSRKKLSRVTSVGDLRFPTDHSPEDKWGVGRVSGSSDRGRGRSSADESRASSRGSSHKDSGGGSSSGGGGGPRIKLSMSGGSSEGHGKLRKLSSSESSGRPLSTSVVIKEEDPSYIHNRFNLHLDLEVFSKEKGEHFKMIFKSSMVKYKSKKEVAVVAIFSNLNTFIYLVTAPESTHPDKWLALQHTLPLSKLVYLDVGPFHQFLRLEFSIPGCCFTFLLRDKSKCRECLTRLSMIVSDCPKSSFKSVGICPFRLEILCHPDRALREAIMVCLSFMEQLSYFIKGDSRYNNIKVSPPKLKEGQESREIDDDIKVYMLAYRNIHTPGKKHRKVAVTVVVAGDVIYLAQENFHHWPLPRLQELPPREVLEPPFSYVEEKEVTDIEQIVMDPDQTCRVVLRFFKESVGDYESKSWSLTTELEGHVQQLVKAVQTPWENMFETPLPITYK